MRLTGAREEDGISWASDAANSSWYSFGRSRSKAAIKACHFNHNVPHVVDEHHHTDAEPDQDHLLDHAYDGIQEYDNPLPRWWVLLFWLTILVTPIYILYYHYGPGPLAAERYDAEMIAFYDKQAEELLTLLRDTLGSLKVRPLQVKQSPALLMTRWVEGKLPKDFILADECELKEPVDKGSVIRGRRLEHLREDLHHHIDAGADRYPHIGLGQRGCVVYPVTGHCCYPFLILIPFYNYFFIL